MKHAISLGVALLAFTAAGHVCAQTAWNGGTGDWHTGTNWNNGIPSNTVNTTISGGTVNITGGASNENADTNDLSLTGLTNLNISASRTLTVHGNFSASSGNKNVAGNGNLIVQGTQKKY